MNEVMSQGEHKNKMDDNSDSGRSESFSSESSRS